MTVEIPDPPTIAACSSCMRPLRWLWSPRTGQWVAFATEPGDTRVLRVDDCARHGVDRLPSWRDPVRASVPGSQVILAAKAAARGEPVDLP